MHSVRPSAVAGSFYPATANALSRDVAGLLSAANTQAIHDNRDDAIKPPKALIVPHAGYTYSGSTAALAYAQLASMRSVIRRVVLLGPVHRVRVRGLALPCVSAFSTPLGEIELDSKAIESLKAFPQVIESVAAHAQEHSLEVQLPFLQTVLEDFKLVPLAVGEASATEVAAVIEALWGGSETLIVISSDLSHFLPYSVAQRVDDETVEQILHGRGPISQEQACGGTPVNGLLRAGQHRGLRARLLGKCNSGDMGGDKGRVVGYASIAFAEARHAAA